MDLLFLKSNHLRPFIMLRCVLLFLLLGLSSGLRGQTLLERMEMQRMNNNYAYIYDIAVDDTGNVYAAGSFQASPDLNAADPSGNPFLIHSTGATDGYLVKYDPSGRVRWAVTIGSTAGKTEKMYHVSVNKRGVYLEAYTEQSQVFGPDVVTAPGQSPTVIISQLNFSGQYIWSKGFTTHYQWHEFNDLLVDTSGNVLVRMLFRDSVDADPDPNVERYVYRPGGNNWIVIKLDADGKYLWDFPYPGNAKICDMAMDKAGNIYILGDFSGTFDADPGTGNYPLTDLAAGTSGFIAQYHPSGDLLDARVIGNQNTTQVQTSALQVDDQQNLYYTARFTGTLDADPGSGVHSLSSTTTDRSLLCKMNTQLQFRWAYTMGDIRVKDIDIDPSGKPYLFGKFKDSADFLPGSGKRMSYTDNWSIFVMKLHESGSSRGHFYFKPVGHMNPRAFYIDTRENIYISGYADQWFDASPGDRQTIVNRNSFVLKYDTCFTPVSPVLNYDVSQGPRICQGDSVTISVTNAHELRSGEYWHIHALNSGYTDSNTTGIFKVAPDGFRLFEVYGRGSCAGDGEKAFANVWVDSSFIQLSRDTVCEGSSYQFIDGTEWTLNRDTVFFRQYTSVLGCDSTYRTELKVIPEKPSIRFKAGQLEARTEGLNYQWIDCGNGGIAVPGATSRNYQPVVDGRYAVVVYGGSCGDTSACYNWSIGIEEAYETGISLYPNPAGNYVSLQSNFGAPVKVEFYNVKGQQAGIYTDVEKDQQLPVHHLSPGLYLLRISRKGKLLSQHQLVVSP